MKGQTIKNLSIKQTSSPDVNIEVSMILSWTWFQNRQCVREKFQYTYCKNTQFVEVSTRSVRIHHIMAHSLHVQGQLKQLLQKRQKEGIKANKSSFFGFYLFAFERLQIIIDKKFLHRKAWSLHTVNRKILPYLLHCIW